MTQYWVPPPDDPRFHSKFYCLEHPDLRFAESGPYQKHLRDHHKIGWAICSKCGNQTRDGHYLRRHHNHCNVVQPREIFFNAKTLWLLDVNLIEKQGVLKTYAAQHHLIKGAFQEFDIDWENIEDGNKILVLSGEERRRFVDNLPVNLRDKGIDFFNAVDRVRVERGWHAIGIPEPTVCIQPIISRVY